MGSSGSGEEEYEGAEPVNNEELRASIEQLIAAIQRLPTPLDSEMVAMGVLKLALEYLERADAAKQAEQGEA